MEFYQYPFSSVFKNQLSLFLNGWKGADCFIGVDPVNCYVGLWLKRFGRVKKLVLYQIDYQEKRFPNRLKNWVYHHFLKASVTGADEVWTMSRRMMRQLGRGIVVPTGYSESELPAYQKPLFDFVLAGSVSKEKGADMALEALPSNASMLLVSGIPCHKEMLETIAEGRVGLATYHHGLADYGDPGRVKEYLALGMPVIMTDIPEFAETVRREEAGLVVPETVGDIRRAMKDFRDPLFYQHMKENAARLGKRYRYDAMFGEAIAKL